MGLQFLVVIFRSPLPVSGTVCLNISLYHLRSRVKIFVPHLLSHAALAWSRSVTLYADYLLTCAAVKNKFDSRWCLIAAEDGGRQQQVKRQRSSSTSNERVHGLVTDRAPTRLSRRPQATQRRDQSTPGCSLASTQRLRETSLRRGGRTTARDALGRVSRLQIHASQEPQDVPDIHAQTHSTRDDQQQQQPEVGVVVTWRDSTSGGRVRLGGESVLRDVAPVVQDPCGGSSVWNRCA